MLKRWYLGKKSIQTKLLLSYVLLIVLPMGLFSVVSYYFSKKSLEEQISQNNLKTLSQIQDKIDMVFDDIIAVSNIYYLNEDVRNALVSDYIPRSYEEAQANRTIEKFNANYVYAYGRVYYNTTIIGMNGYQFYSDRNVSPVSIEHWKQAKWYPDVIQKNGSLVWLSGNAAEKPIQKSAEHEISAVRVIKTYETNRNLGLLILSLSETELQKFYQDAEIGEQRIEIVNEQGTIISSGDKERINADVKNNELLNHTASSKSGYFSDTVEGQRMLITYQTVDKTGWKIISYTPLSQLLKDINRMAMIYTVLFFGLLFLAFIVSYLVARKLAIPVRSLYRDISKVEMGDLSVRTKVMSDDEIGQLAGKFNVMVSTINELMSNVIAEQRKKQTAEIVALQSQINPHFLYNTLTTIRYMLAKQSIDKVDAVIVALGKLLRMSFSRHDEFITIREEIDILKQYVFIQQARQGEGLEVYFEVDEEILDCKTIKLVLQPIVENAIFHGIEPQGSQGVIYIRAYQSDKDIIFEISDDGVGMDKPAAILSAAAGLSSKGIGLKNVHQRLQLYFGEAYGLKVYSQIGEGTQVSLTIPAVK